jgi:hypothetical protein
MVLCCTSGATQESDTYVATRRHTVGVWSCIVPSWNSKCTTSTASVNSGRLVWHRSKWSRQTQSWLRKGNDRQATTKRMQKIFIKFASVIGKAQSSSHMICITTAVGNPKITMYKPSQSYSSAPMHVTKCTHERALPCIRQAPRVMRVKTRCRKKQRHKWYMHITGTRNNITDEKGYREMMFCRSEVCRSREWVRRDVCSRSGDR